MMHDHDGLPGFDNRHIWHDGCGECEHRAATVPSSIGTLDNNNLVRAWNRMRDWDHGTLDVRLSNAEIPLMQYLEQVRLTAQAMYRAGVDVTA
jgi:hypothetical protein